MLLYKPKKNNHNQDLKGRRFLINVTVLGSAGPIRFVVHEDDLVAAVIDTTLRSYAREGRLPLLGSEINSFMLYCPNAGTEALHAWDTIGSVGVRNFTLCKKPKTEDVAIADEKAYVVPSSSKGTKIWKSWFHKTRSVRIPSH